MGYVNREQVRAAMAYQNYLDKEREKNTVRIPTRLLQAVHKARTKKKTSKPK